MELEMESVITVSVVIAIAGLSAAIAARYAQYRVVQNVQSDIKERIEELHHEIETGKENTLSSSKVGRFRNRPPRVYEHDGNE